MDFEDFKLEIFHFREALFKYKVPFQYIYNKFFLYKKIVKSDQVLEKPVNNHDLSIHVMACRRDFIMLIWALKSFYNKATIIGRLYIHNNINLTNKNKAILKKLFPSCQIVEVGKFVKNNNVALNHHPLIKKFRSDMKWTRFFAKLIDPYFIVDTKYKLIIDSDMLWFKSPVEIEQELKNQCHQSLMITNDGLCRVAFKDKDEFYGYNSGIVLYHKNNFNINKLNNYLKRLDVGNKINVHFIEQAGYAYCLDNLRGLSIDIYHVKGKVTSNSVLKHYTSPRRVLFYTEGIRKIVNK